MRTAIVGAGAIGAWLQRQLTCELYDAQVLQWRHLSQRPPCDPI